MQRDTTVGIPIFPSDGISRIRFTGQSQQAHSQPDASGPPKTYLLGVDDIIQKMGKIVKHRSVILSERKRVEGSFRFRQPDSRRSFDSLTLAQDDTLP